MNDNDEIEELASLRDDVALMSARADQAGRRRLREEISGPAARRTRTPSRRLVLSGAAGALTAGLIGYQVTGPRGSQPAAAAAVLNRAADALAAEPALQPRPDQYLYRESLERDGSHMWWNRSWESADGSRPGLVKTTGDKSARSYTLPPYRSEQGLAYAPYLVAARLPTDPESLLARLTEDRSIRIAMGYGSSRTHAVWNLLRELVRTAPPAQQAALFRAASKIPGIRLTDTAVDALGRTGVAVGLYDPALGRVELVFDKSDYGFLGERITDEGRAADVQLDFAIRRTAVVDRIGQLPSRTL